MRLMKPISKQVYALCQLSKPIVWCRTLELDALQLEEEEEGPSYLADLNKAPDFVDEPPVEEAEVSIYSIP